ncbi:MAG: hypothetical protein ABIM74_00055 [candidate division WOR-3 bacterium]
MPIGLVALILIDTASGIYLSLPEPWTPSYKTMTPGLNLVCGNLIASLEYTSVVGKGWTQLDVIRVNQEAIRDFMEGSRYSKQGAMEEIGVEGATLYRSWACAMKSDGDHVIYIVTAGWRLGERGTVGMFLQMKIERKGALKFSEEEEEAIDRLLRGFSFQ